MTQLTDRPPQPPPSSPTAFFATENPDNIDAVAGMGMRAAFHAVFHHYATADEFEGSKDHDTELARMCSATGLSLAEVRSAVYAYRTLKDLPILHALQEATHRLDLRRLKAIDRAISVLGDTPDPEVFAALDALLVSLFTPTKSNQALPGANTITTRLNKAIGDMDSSVAYDSKKREKREQGRTLLPGECEVTFHDGYYHGTTGMTLIADHATSASVKAFIGATAKEHGITDDEATLLLLTGKLSPTPTARVFGYAPKNRDGTIDESASVFIPGYGFTTATGTEMFHSFEPKLVDMMQPPRAASLAMSHPLTSPHSFAAATAPVSTPVVSAQPGNASSTTASLTASVVQQQRATCTASVSYTHLTLPTNREV